MGMYSAMPSVIVHEGRTVQLRRIATHEAYGAGDDGHIYTFYQNCLGFGRYDFAMQPRPLTRMGTGSHLFVSMDSPGGHFECGGVIKLAWHGPSEVSSKTRVLPLNGDWYDFRPDNLEWCTKKERMKLFGYKHSRPGEKNSQAILDDVTVRFIRQHVSRLSSPVLAAMCGVGLHLIYSIRERKTWKHLDVTPLEPVAFNGSVNGLRAARDDKYPRIAITDTGRIFSARLTSDGQSIDWDNAPELHPMSNGYVKCTQADGGTRTVTQLVLMATAWHGRQAWGVGTAVMRDPQGPMTPDNVYWKKREQRGETNGHAKLTADQATAIRSAKGTVSSRELAEQYGVSMVTVQHIWSGRSWKCLVSPQDSSY